MRWDLNLKPVVFPWYQAALLGRALDQARVSRTTFVCCVAHPHPGAPPFLQESSDEGSGLTLHWGCHISHVGALEKQPKVSARVGEEKPLSTCCVIGVR